MPPVGWMSPRGLAKTLLRTLANVAVGPILLSFSLGRIFLGPDRALQHSSEWLSLIPGMAGQQLRRAFLAWTLAECHPSAYIGFGSTFSKCDARIAENVYVGPGCRLGRVHLGRDTLLGPGVEITSGSRMHGISDPSKSIREQPGVFERVTIGEGCWIGSKAVVMADVGAGSVIGAGAVVTRPIPPMSIAGGVPAKVIRSRIDADETRV